MAALFLDRDEMRELTGRSLKRLQIDWLKAQGIPFRVNALGWAKVVRSVIEGKAEAAPAPAAAKWSPGVLN